MNKTVDINLANMLFHIDEDAYNKMRRYLESVKRSFANTPGSDEILSDIEARIAEIFSEKLDSERQVITVKQVDDVIAIMGQPEDYMVDEDIFEDEPKATNTSYTARKPKKLYRDTDQKYVAGVSAGLGHYLGIDPLWIRIIWVLLTIGSSGGFILIYGLLWILIPEAKTTAQKLDMRGEPVNISNIERKVKEGFDDVADKVKSVDYEKVGNKVKNGSKTFFDTLGEIILFAFKVFGKFIGVLLIIIGGATLIGLFVGMLTVGVMDLINVPGLDFYNVINTSGLPIWLASTLVFFAIGIPFFFVMYLGLKILVTNLRSIGNVAKFSLLGLWLISVSLLIGFGIREAAQHAYTGTVKTTQELNFTSPMDTLVIRTTSSRFYDEGDHVRMDNMLLVHDEEGNPMLQSENVRYSIEKSKDSVFALEIRKEADGPSYIKAKETAKLIHFDYEIEGNILYLNDFLTVEGDNKFNDQEARITLFIPVGTVVTYENERRGREWIMRADTDREGDNLQNYQWKMAFNGQLICLDCPLSIEYDEEDDYGDDHKNRIKINADGIDININDNGEKGKIIINEDGIDIDVEDNGESFKMKLDENGMKIKADEKDRSNTKEVNKD